MKDPKKPITAAMIAAVYAALTLMLSPVSYGAVQLRLSEVLTVLPVFCPASIAGLTVGCFVSNIFSTVSPLDMIIGTLATFIAAVLSRLLRKVRVFNLPILSFLAPVAVNALLIGLEITLFVAPNASLGAFLLSAGSVAVGQLIPCVVLGIPLYYLIEKTNLKTILDI